MSHRTRRTVAWVVVIVVGSVGVLRAEAAAREAQRTADTVREAQLDNEAQQCVDDWELVDAMRLIGPASNEALIAAFPNSDPAKIEAVKEATARVVGDLVEDPSCDLEAARRRLKREEGP